MHFMSLLSKSEIQFLKGQKQVSKSYERKLKYIIRKKVESLEDELPLVARLFDIDDLIRNISNSNQPTNKYHLDNNNIARATEFSNFSSDGLEATKISNPGNVSHNNSHNNLSKSRMSRKYHY